MTMKSLLNRKDARLYFRLNQTIYNVNKYPLVHALFSMGPLAPSSGDRSARVPQLAFLRIVCSHEHYVSLSLPGGCGTGAASPAASHHSHQSASSAPPHALSHDFRSRHYLAGLLLHDLTAALDLQSVPAHPHSHHTLHTHTCPRPRCTVTRHHQSVTVPTTGAQAFLMDYT
jgi:hypothetical protein